MISPRADAIALTGFGVISAAGRDAAALRRALDSNACHLGPLDDAITKGLSVHEGGRVADSAVNDLLPSGDCGRFSLLVRLAAEEALRHAGIRVGPGSSRVGLSLGTALAGIDVDAERDRAASSAAHRPNRILGELARSLGLSGPASIFSATCVSSLYALEQAIFDLERGRATAVLCGGADTLGRFMQAGFSSLGTLEGEASAGEKGRPLGERFLLGEAAAFVVLETRAGALSRGATVLGHVAGRAIRSDARHLTSPDPEGAAMAAAIEAALEEAGRSREDVGAVSLTAVNSPAYERMYRNVLARVFGGTEKEKEKEIPTSTWEASIGHVLAASGTLGLVHALFQLEPEGLLAASGKDVLVLTVGFGGQSGATVVGSSLPTRGGRT